MNSRRSWLIWGVALFAYVIAVMQRTSLGVSGIEAAHRFDVSASALSSLAVVQLIVYAALQIPTGVLLDRVGPKVLIAAGAVLMFAGQTTLALAPSIGIAILGRILVGAGDALTFISVIRLLASWFRGRILPQVSQWTGNIGQLGQVLSAIPLSLLLHRLGWQPAFLSAAALSLIASVLVIVLLSNGNPTRPPADAAAPESGAANWRGAVHQLRESLARPGTQLGFWSHFVTQSSGTVFSLLWGFPLLTAGLGYSPGTASALLTLIVAAGVVSGPILGILTARFPLRRSNLVIAIVVMIGVTWTTVLLWPGHPPFWLVVTLVVVLGIGGPGSLIGFDFARTFNPMRSLGSANGVVNVGGFLASFVMMYLIGLVLDIQNTARVAGGAASEVFAWDSFRIALLVQYLVIGTGMFFLVRARRLTRVKLHAEEGITVAPLWVSLVRFWRRRTD
ncbi:MFS transporter [Glaciihabitans sp. INWT7]|uniref:MFS transporter n=1 Tax=Glaciihabitans sp. INWT7 TaxID=2596912 RepID=UPI001624C9CE|nr:MFS transporter [Glaciihabitans sp. INWT7]QNE46951.1 MFS transporter [Glaciihabitans sp. INWT7]